MQRMRVVAPYSPSRYPQTFEAYAELESFLPLHRRRLIVIDGALWRAYEFFTDDVRRIERHLSCLFLPYFPDAIGITFEKGAPR